MIHVRRRSAVLLLIFASFACSYYLSSRASAALVDAQAITMSKRYKNGEPIYHWSPSWTFSGGIVDASAVDVADHSLDDRVNLVFFGPKLNADVKATTILTHNWKGSNGDMEGVSGLFCLDKQQVRIEGAGFLNRYLSMGGSGYYDNDGTTVTHPTPCADQFHVRLWSSLHERLANQYTHIMTRRNYWTVGGVHYDDLQKPSYDDFDCGTQVDPWDLFLLTDAMKFLTCYPKYLIWAADECAVAHTCHKRSMTFEEAEHVAAKELGENLCVRRDWAFVPFSDNWDQGNYEYSDGRITWISTQRRPTNGGQCAPSGAKRLKPTWDRNSARYLYSRPELNGGAPMVQGEW